MGVMTQKYLIQAREPLWLLGYTRRVPARFRKLISVGEKLSISQHFSNSWRYLCDQSREKVRRMSGLSQLSDEQNWKLILSYDGADYFGWQVQPERPTIQGELSDAIERVTAERVLPQGSGRTDAGVHARAQVASFFLRAPIPPENLHRALNRTLPESIRVLRVEKAPPEFHARHSAKARTYEYRIFRGEVCPPWTVRFAWALNWPLNPNAMHEAAALVVGTHDFTSFAASDPDLAARRAELRADEQVRQGPVRTIFESAWSREYDLLIYRVRGDGFLHHMVRNLIGTFIEVGRGTIAPTELTRILEARDRTQAGPTAPARGLFLDSVEY